MVNTNIGHSVKALAGTLPSNAVPRERGSLASAFQDLNSEIESAEQNMKALWERIVPLLEPTASGAGQNANPPTPAVSPLAESVYEYAVRVRQIQASLAEICNRFSY
jgi:hypothetical protein